MRVSLNVRMSKIMCMPVKLGVRVYATYAKCSCSFKKLKNVSWIEVEGVGASGLQSLKE